MSEATIASGLRTSRVEIAVAAVLLAGWFALMTPLARWGLPSRANDDLLFGGGPAWSAERFGVEANLAARHERDAGADTDLDARAGRDAIVDLTATEADRAAILRRYRLFTRQPDEMITFMALQRMDPRAGDFDPRLYQYGGAYIYGVGAAIAAAGSTGLITLSSDGVVYLQNPELFGAFYFVARLVTLAFGAALLIAVGRLAGRFGGRVAAWLAPLALAATPVFLSDCLEAKPHLPSACMALWATLAALRFAETNRMRDALRMGVFAGLSFGFVLTGASAAALWVPLLLLAGRGRVKWQPLVFSGAAALAVYGVTNPYVVLNAISGNAALTSNIGNSTAMYSLAHMDTGAFRVAQLLVESGGPGLCFVGAWALLWLFGWRPLTGSGLLVSAAAALTLLCAALGAGKPAEFARFLLLPTAVLCIAAAAYIATKLRTSRLLAGGFALAMLVPMNTAVYVRSFYDDAGGVFETRRAAGEFIERSLPTEMPIGVVQEPAPYSIPPLDFTRRRVVLLPSERPASLDEPSGSGAQTLPTWLVGTGDDLASFDETWWRGRYELFCSFGAERGELSRITWADKPVYVLRKIGPPRIPGEEPADDRMIAEPPIP